VALGLSGCGGNQSSLSPHSHPAHEISLLWWVMLGGSVVGFSVIGLLLLLGWARRRREGLPFGIGESGATKFVVGLGIAVPMVVLISLFVWSDVFVIKSTAAPTRGSTALTVDVVGKQWWWEIRYPGTAAVTANELHIPVGQRVRVVVTTGDVIHSFWVPELNRKIDTIPGRQNEVLLYADRPGVYRGQCAEFCGLQHAHMAMLVVAEPPAAFRSWLAHESAPARAGLPRAFDAENCSSCHAIRGTSADGQVGPDLTHVASRSTLAAATIDNTPVLLRAWIRDPQAIKPGAKMPKLPLAKPDLDALVAYLEKLR
jgi:cytochrome c oxidase subunit 2